MGDEMDEHKKKALLMRSARGRNNIELLQRFCKVVAVKRSLNCVLERRCK